MDGPFHRFRLGGLDCVVLSDGRFEYAATTFFSNADPAEVDAALACHGIVTGRIETPYACLLVDTPAARVLIDTGGAGWAPTVGNLSDSMAAAGIAPSSVDFVILTHGHPDHIGGTVGPDGHPVFDRAVHVMAADEWSYWTSPVSLATVPERFRDIALHNLPPVAGRMRLVAGTAQVVPGVTLLPTPGHTPGHLAVIVDDGGQELVYLSDAILHPIQLEHPGWGPKYDIDPTRAADTRRLLCERLGRGGSLVHAYHFDPFPCLGWVRPSGDGWRWEPIAVSEPAIA